MSLQQKVIAEYCENEILKRGLIAEKDFSVDACVLRNVSRIDQGEYLVMRFRGDVLYDIDRLDGFHSAQNIEEDSIVISSRTLEARFHDQHQI
jgi:hypothetical protein